jgi:hypothetical protein
VRPLGLVIAGQPFGVFPVLLDHGKAWGRLKVSNVTTATINAGAAGTLLLIYTAWGTGLVEVQASLAESHNANQPTVDRDSGAAHAGGSARCKAWETPLVVRYPGMHPSGTGRVSGATRRGRTWPLRVRQLPRGAAMGCARRPAPACQRCARNLCQLRRGNAQTNADGGEQVGGEEKEESECAAPLDLCRPRLNRPGGGIPMTRAVLCLADGPARRRWRCRQLATAALPALS